MIVTAAIRPAAAGDWPRILALLAGAGLPTEDLPPRSVGDFTVVTDAGEVVGAVAVERYGTHGLLRSLVVDSNWRGRGLGRALVAAAESAAIASELESLTLLTQTAAPFFRDLAYRDISRSNAPAALQVSAEFTHLCPSSSNCLTKSLRL
jgi:amino-acid N-acetyltransferase